MGAGAPLGVQCAACGAGAGVTRYSVRRTGLCGDKQQAAMAGRSESRGQERATPEMSRNQVLKRMAEN